MASKTVPRIFHLKEENKNYSRRITVAFSVPKDTHEVRYGFTIWRVLTAEKNKTAWDRKAHNHTARERYEKKPNILNFACSEWNKQAFDDLRVAIRKDMFSHQKKINSPQ